jgi:hypothetical protein
VSGEQADPLQASAVKPERRQLFISYSHRDREWVERLRTMIKPLEQRYGLERWDSRIPAGMVWREGIEEALVSAQVALLMVSADFLAFDFVMRKDSSLTVPNLLARILWFHLDLGRYQGVHGEAGR